MNRSRILATSGGSQTKASLFRSYTGSFNQLRLACCSRMIAWTGYSEDALAISHGTPKTINSSGAAMRSFCADCGTGLFYRHAEILPDVVEVQLATLDDPNALTPTAHIQTAERIGWMKDTHNLPTFDRFPE